MWTSLPGPLSAVTVLAHGTWVPNVARTPEPSFLLLVIRRTARAGVVPVPVPLPRVSVAAVLGPKGGSSGLLLSTDIAALYLLQRRENTDTPSRPPVRPSGSAYCPTPPLGHFSFSCPPPPAPSRQAGCVHILGLAPCVPLCIHRACSVDLVLEPGGRGGIEKRVLRDSESMRLGRSCDR